MILEIDVFFVTIPSSNICRIDLYQMSASLSHKDQMWCLDAYTVCVSFAVIWLFIFVKLGYSVCTAAHGLCLNSCHRVSTCATGVVMRLVDR